MKNGSIDTTVNAEDEDSYLYLSVPVDDDWDVLVNNKKAEVKSFGNCLYAIKLHSGTNKITMRYHTKHKKTWYWLNSRGNTIYYCECNL